MEPIDLVHTSSNSELAEIQWFIPAIVYTQENYTVVYGVDQALLNYTSDVVVGTSNIAQENQVYSTTLRNLDPNTTYYYQVIASNSVGTNSSDVEVLVTPLPSKGLSHCISEPNDFFSLVLMISVNSSGNASLGEMLTLECFVTREVNVSGSLLLQWMGPDGSQVVSTGPVVVGSPVTSGDTTSLSLQFSTLYTSHGGLYTCRGNFDSQNITYNVSSSQDVIVLGNFLQSAVQISLLCFISAVPAPSVSITGLPTYPLFAGTSLLLTCTFQLPSTIDSPVALNNVWRRGGTVISYDSRVNISDMSMNPPIHQSILSISPLSNIIDSGQYSCQTGIASSAYVRYTDAFQEVSVIIEGKIAILLYEHAMMLILFSIQDLPVPAIAISSLGSLIAGENYTLSCTITVIEGLTEDAVISTSWTNSRGDLMISDITQVSDVNTTSTLEFMPIMTSQGGSYICNASINISTLSVYKSNSEPYDISIQSEYRCNSGNIIILQLLCLLFE